MRTDIIEDLQKKHRNLMYNLINNFSNKVDKQDLESIGNEVLFKCAKKWNPARAKFSTLFYRALTNAFSSECKKVENRIHFENAAAQQLSHIEVKEPISNWMENFLLRVSRDSRQMILILFSKQLAFGTDTKTRAAIRKEMRAQKWNDERIKKSFQEIKEALG